MKPSKQIIVDFIVEQMRIEASTEKICAVTCRKFQFTERTFYNHFKQAKDIHLKEQKSIKEVKLDIHKQKAKEEEKNNILTAEQKKEILRKIALGEIKVKKPFVIAGKIMEYPAEPDHTDRKNAIAELNKMEGDYAAQKQDVTIHSPMIIDWNGENNTDIKAT
jgi:hypothetical protein